MFNGLKKLYSKNILEYRINFYILSKSFFYTRFFAPLGHSIPNKIHFLTFPFIIKIKEFRVFFQKRKKGSGIHLHRPQFLIHPQKKEGVLNPVPFDIHESCSQSVA